MYGEKGKLVIQLGVMRVVQDKVRLPDMDYCCLHTTVAHGSKTYWSPRMLICWRNPA